MTEPCGVNSDELASEQAMLLKDVMADKLDSCCILRSLITQGPAGKLPFELDCSRSTEREYRDLFFRTQPKYIPRLVISVVTLKQHRSRMNSFLYSLLLRQ